MNCPSKLRASIGKQLRVLYIHTSSAPPPLAITLINEGRLVICPSALKFCLFWLTPQKSGALTPTLSPTKQKKKKGNVWLIKQTHATTRLQSRSLSNRHASTYARRHPHAEQLYTLGRSTLARGRRRVFLSSCCCS